MVVAALVGALIGLVAVLAYRFTTPSTESFGWYGYSPLTSDRVSPFGRQPWWPGVVVAPLAAAILTALVAFVAVRRGWLHPGR